MKCSQIDLGSVDVAVPEVPPQTTVTVLRRVTRPAGVQYVDAIADINETVRESNEENNSFTGVGACIR
jgi:subtilase family serine protease